MSKGSEERIGYFLEPKGARDFLTAFTKTVSEAQQSITDQYLNPENVHRFRHGGSWQHPARPDIPEGQLRSHSAEMATSFQSLVDNELGLVDKSIAQITEAMGRQLLQSIYSTLTDACDQSGNVVQVGDSGSPIKAFAQMLKKIEFSCARDGTVELPQLHLGSEAFKAFEKAFEKITPEERAEIDALKEEKTHTARQREAERKKRFIRYGGQE